MMLYKMSAKYEEGISEEKLLAASLNGEFESMSCERLSGIKEAQCTENITSALHMNIHTEQHPDKLGEETDDQLINYVKASNAIKIKNEFSEEDTVINYGKVYNDEGSKMDDFKAILVKEEQCVFIKTEVMSDVNQDGVKEEQHIPRFPSSAEPSNTKDSQTIGSYKCKLCHKYVVTRNSLMQHMRVHTGEKPFGCDFCGRRFTVKTNLTKHIRLHTGEKPYKCDICEKIFARKDNLASHNLVHSEKQAYKCSTCEKIFSRKDRLLTHVRLHSVMTSYPCDVCNKKYSRIDNLRSHKLLHSGQLPYTCEFCERKFSRKDFLALHIRSHTGEKPYACETCGKQFSRKFNLVEHNLLHSGKQLHKCDFCGRKFSRKDRLLAHIKRLHS